MKNKNTSNSCRSQMLLAAIAANLPGQHELLPRIANIPQDGIA